MADAPDHYATLGVDRCAEPEVIDAAYRALARKYHPDVNRSPDAAERTRALNEAYRTLHDAALRARYDAQRALARTTWSAPRAPVPRDERPVELFGAAVADAWRRLRPEAGPRRDTSVPDTPGEGLTRRGWLVPALLVATGAALGGAGVAGLGALGGRASRALRTYWGAAAAGRGAVLEARQPHEALAAGGYAAVAANVSFGSLATQLVAELDGATARLRGAGAIPAEAEAYHFLQLDDWREERDVRMAQREAVQSRMPEAWATAGERAIAWRTSALHAKTEIAATHLAALISRS